MEQLLASCSQAAIFPKNIICHDTYEHCLRAYLERLNKQEIDLFSEGQEARVDLVDFGFKEQRALSKSKVSLQELQAFLQPENGKGSHCTATRRFVFLTAPNSRARLYISRDLLNYILSYHQVMPSFLDFLFSFGRQEGTRDLHFTGFWQESRLDPWYSRLQVPELGRSGKELRMCYNLKSVEPAEYQPHMPWSIRQTAIYHSLDLETGQSFWIVLKGNNPIKKRAQESMHDGGKKFGQEELGRRGEAFVESLATHMIVFDWCNESWRWYISYLEEVMTQRTKYSFAVMLEVPSVPNTEELRNARTTSTVSRQFSRETWWSRRNTLRSLSKSSQKEQVDLKGPLTELAPPHTPLQSSSSPPLQVPLNPNYFSFTDFQEVQLTGDRVNEVLLVLASNISVLEKIQAHYHTASYSEHWPAELKSRCGNQLERFENKIACIIDDFRIQQSRATTLLRLVADRKDLLSGILGLQNIKASNMLAFRAQESQNDMMLLTKDMHALARKTKSETVSMRIITLVTLFFLPGTLVSTIMSTQIVTFETGQDGKTRKVFQSAALQLFMAICLPMMFVVFVAWYGVYWWVEQKQTEDQEKQFENSEQV